MDIRILEFEKRYTTVDGNSLSHDWVLYGPAGNIKDCQTWERVDRLKPLADDDDKHRRDPMGGKLFHMKAVWSILGPAYEAWEKGHAMPEDGTPLKLWAGVDSGQVAEFIKLGLKTVEDVASMTDGLIAKVNLPRVRITRDEAIAYLASRKESATDERVDALQEKLNAAMELLEQQTAVLSTLKPKAKPKAKRKVKEAA